MEETPGAEELLVVGRIIRPHGIRGAVIVEAISDFPERFRQGSSLLAGKPDRIDTEITVESAAPHQGRLLIRLREVETREDAERLRGCHLFIRAREAAALEENEFWIHELIGMKAEDENAVELGTVEDVISGPAQDLLMIVDEAGREFYVPLVGEFVTGVDRDSSRLTMRLIEGMGPES